MTAPLDSETLTRRTVLTVPGMHCAGCIGKVERGLAEVPGITQARVNLSARSVTVTHTLEIEEPRLIEALARIGFEAQPRRDELAPRTSAVRPLLAPLAVAFFAAMNVMTLSVSIWSGADGITRALFHWLSALIGVPAIAYAGMPFFRSAWGVLKRGRTNMDVPISIGVVIATCLSLYETAVHGRHAWFDGALMLLTFLLAGRVLDAMMRDRARAGVDALLRQAAPGAMVIEADGALRWHTAQDLAPGMLMRTAAGERLAADGEIVGGGSRFDQSLLTGESVPVSRTTGELVLAGTLNLDAPVDVRVSRAGQDTSLAEIARLMESAGQSRSRYVRIADRAARLYAPVVHTLAAVAVLGWLLAGAGLYKALVVGVTVLIITCPCALGLAVPVAQVVVSSALMRAGVMVKDGSALERLAGVDRALLDKTGTLTLGRPTADPAALTSLTAEEAAICLALASHSRHPLSRSLSSALAAAGHCAIELTDVAEVAGTGVCARWNGQPVALRRPEQSSGMASALVIGERPARLISFSDRLRPDTAEALARLRRMGIAPSIISGDNAEAVVQIANETGLPATAQAAPAEKQEAIAGLQEQGHTVLMVGDGLNDGPALATANASMAPGSASDVGLQAADLVFISDSLLAVPRAVSAARASMKIVRQNFGLSIAYNVLAVPLALAGMLTPLIAAAAMSASSLVVIANSLRLARAVK